MERIAARHGVVPTSSMTPKDLWGEYGGVGQWCDNVYLAASGVPDDVVQREVRLQEEDRQTPKQDIPFCLGPENHPNMVSRLGDQLLECHVLC